MPISDCYNKLVLFDFILYYRNCLLYCYGDIFRSASYKPATCDTSEKLRKFAFSPNSNVIFSVSTMAYIWRHNIGYIYTGKL